MKCLSVHYILIDFGFLTLALFNRQNAWLMVMMHLTGYFWARVIRIMC